eukprot:GHVU01110223.1.p1 GENE.GHVU01110223.1~~GHVU01110223.1.p1  ORF type:complete len:292 (-),score=38.78 GHVU01110223.1:576-1325(-)
MASPRAQKVPKVSEFQNATKLEIVRNFYSCGRSMNKLHLVYTDALPVEAELLEWEKKRNYVGRSVLMGLGSEMVLPKTTLPLVWVNGDIVNGKSTGNGKVKVLFPQPIFVRTATFPYWHRPGGNKQYVILQPWLNYEARYIPQVANSNDEIAEKLQAIHNAAEMTYRKSEETAMAARETQKATADSVRIGKQAREATEEATEAARRALEQSHQTGQQQQSIMEEQRRVQEQQKAQQSQPQRKGFGVFFQ